MVKKDMYKKIQQMKRQGLNKSQISKTLKLARRTVIKYYDMTETEYQMYLVDMMYRNKKLDRFKQAILDVYHVNEYKKMNMAAVYDYLEEKFGKLPCSENTLRYYIAYLLQTGELSYSEKSRSYEKVPELPYGKQMQLDFGVYKQDTRLTLYIFCALLSGSRFKYVAFQDTPFTKADVIAHLLDTFDYFQGRPKEMVIDQDRVMVVSENHGDIIYTSDFSHFIHEMDLTMYVCRKADPESKGKVENLVKFVKHNFLAVRTFSGLSEARTCLSSWLIRRANGKISQATGCIPLQEIEKERQALRPLKNSLFRKQSVIHRESRLVSDNCLISYQASSYSVPSRYKNKSVDMYAADGKLFIFDETNGKQIAEHPLSLLPGGLITDRSHKREKEKKVNELKQAVMSLFTISGWETFCRKNYKEFPRYVRDQCLIGRTYFTRKKIELPFLKQALQFCLENETLSFPNLISTYEHFLNKGTIEQRPVPAVLKRTETKQHTGIPVKARSVTEYNALIPANQEAMQ